MQSRTNIGAAAALLLSGAFATGVAQQSTPSAPQQLKVSIDTQQIARPISPYEYGMFIEHIGPVIYRSLWSEMLDDRKFYFPISSNAPESESQTPGGPSRGRQLRHWRPVGPDGAIVMQRDQAFVGEQSPRIQMDGSSPHGVRQ